MDKLTQIAHLVYGILTQSKTDGIADKTVQRAIGTIIYDIPHSRTGLVSKSLIDEYGYRPPLNKCCSEHFHSRQRSGEILTEMVNPTIDGVIEFLREATQTHLTTSAENMVLSKIQNHPATKHLPWEEQYALAGIELVPDPDKMPAKIRNKLKKQGLLC